MNIEQLGNLVPDGSMIRATFIGRTDGEVHEVIGRVGVKKHLTGGTGRGGLKFNPFEKGLLPVYGFARDSKGRFINKGYRFIPADSIISIKSAGVEYKGDVVGFMPTT